ncbi:phosphoribosylaminoimidazolesuccinocarboxamide synthase [Aureliella helgolandensis]|uniref:Phosphoribosylaminoimidazole-succinocarboxamide synthase n=1 Tax=Aureliella helgolandensis TaxID=2527968 RepID=A0A518GEN3_9BACT|nr:phosphoribosylaminoimidazolesuccinocarboxamide synthase [Aureliella helgolandensis]QDV27059.1 Phosphoribosylaminoimidazole-succinocarboxamide synthase [Aureliella helgolandensis]
MGSESAVVSTALNYPRRQGKVRDVYDLGTSLLIVSTDRISAFDWILPGGIPRKGVVLTQISRFWFERLQVEHHLLSTDLPADLDVTGEQRAELADRVMVTKKAQVVPYECVVRGFLEGSGWLEYQQTGKVCGVPLPAGLRQCDRLPEPIFTPATKAEAGHDENVSFETMAADIGLELATELREKSLDVYRQGAQWAESKGIIIADTKFEWGWSDDRLILIDEVLTPDSSRFWPADSYTPGRSQLSFDKQFVREWLMESDWDRNSPPPALPPEVIAQTSQKYESVYSLLTSRQLPQPG